MPEKTTIRRARRAKSQGKKPTTQAGEFVREEMHHVKEGKHGAKNRAQAIAVGLSKARRSGVKVPAKKRATSSRNKRKVAGAKSSKPPQRSPARARRSTSRTSTSRRSTSKTGARRAPTARRASAKTSRARSTTRKSTTGRSRSTARKSTTSRSKKR